MKTSVLVAILFIHMKLFSQCYTVTTTTYVQDTSFSTATIAPATDDHWSDVIPIGFTFCFYGAQYDSLLLGNNGVLTFDIQFALGYCIWPINSAIPTPSGNTIHNSIMLPWQDLSTLTSPSQFIYFRTSGVAPNRTFTVFYDSLGMYGSSTDYFSGRAILYEGSNNIEIQIDHKAAYTGWNQGKAILGIQNQTGTSATVPGTQYNYPVAWTASQQAWLFTPICNVCSGVGVAENENVNQFSVYPNPSTGNFTMQIQSTSSTITSYDVIDISGRVVRSAKVNPLTDQQIQFTLENPGMYFIRVFDESNAMVKSEKIVVE